VNFYPFLGVLLLAMADALKIFSPRSLSVTENLTDFAPLALKPAHPEPSLQAAVRDRDADANPVRLLARAS
jgi:hypothetical protein